MMKTLTTYLVIVAAVTTTRFCSLAIAAQEGAMDIAPRDDRQGSSQPTYFEFYQTAHPDDIFTIELTDSDRIREARALLARATVTVVLGKVIKERRPYNQRWSFFLEPSSIEFAHDAIQGCAAPVAGVEEHLSEVGKSILPGNIWCPWNCVVSREVKY